MKTPSCMFCNGKGGVPWSSRYAADKDRFSMSGDIRLENTSICGMCSGTGMKRNNTLIQRVNTPPEEWALNYDVTSRFRS